MKHDRTGRSKGEARHVRLYHWIMETRAWRSLDPVARAAYVDLAALYNSRNNGKIVRSVRDAAAALNVAPATVMRAYQRLEKTGFIATMVKGAFSRKMRHATEWRLTEFNCDVTGEIASKDFARWGQTAALTVHVVKPENSKHGARSETICARSETAGARSETAKLEKGRHGARSETSNAPNRAALGARGETHIVYQGESASTAPTERGRSAPTGSAVASPRVTPLLRKPSLAAPQDGEKAA